MAICLGLPGVAMRLRSRQGGSVSVPVTLGLILLLGVLVVLWARLGLHANSCERVQRVAHFAHLVSGFMPFVGEQAMGLDMTRSWDYAEQATQWTHDKLNEWTRLECPLTPASFAYDRSAGDQRGGDYLKQADPDLYRQLYRGSAGR